MPALATVGQYVDEVRRLLQDEVVPYRYPDDDLIDALNIGLLEAHRIRADLFLPAFVLPWIDPAVAIATNRTKPVAFSEQYRSSLVYYIVGRLQLRDEEPTTDQRAGALLTKFTAQLLTVSA
jgi:hypothetical protein